MGRKGQIAWNKGKKNIFSKEVLKRIGFKKGHISWNKGLKGTYHIHTKEWKEQLGKRMVGIKNNLGKKFPKEKYPNYGMTGKRNWNYIDGRGKSYKSPNSNFKGKTQKTSHIIWCNQPENLPYVPKGFAIHHIDLNPCNNNPNNLFLIDNGTHSKYHMDLIKKYKQIGGVI